MVSNSRILALQAAAALALVGAPIGLLQGRRIRRHTPRLPEAPGARKGSHPGGEPALRIVGLGESPMAAVGLDNQSEALVPRLSEAVGTATGQQVDWCTAARSGATARNTLEALLPTIETGPSDVAIIALGVNDCLRLSSAGRWCDDIERLLAALDERFAPARIILTGVPPMQYFPALPFPLSVMLGRRAALLDAVIARLARQRTRLMHAPMNFAERPDDLFCSDGFHPNARAHELWARQLADLIN